MIQPSASRVRVLRRADLRTPGRAGLQTLLDGDPVVHCFADARVGRGGFDADVFSGQVWGLGPSPRAPLTSAVLVGANMVPIRTTANSRRAFARHAGEQHLRSASLVGPAPEVLDLWGRLAPLWGPARDVRPDQPLLVASATEAAADPSVRAVRPHEAAALVPACVAMYTEEMGVPPIEEGGMAVYEERIRRTIALGRAYARLEGGTVVFKAEIGSLTPRACQLQGVWVHPDRRGEGLGTAGMAAVVELARLRAPLVSLYVNGYNEAALRTYRRVGFTQVGTFATVLL